MSNNSTFNTSRNIPLCCRWCAHRLQPRPTARRLHPPRRWSDLQHRGTTSAPSLLHRRKGRRRTPPLSCAASSGRVLCVEPSRSSPRPPSHRVAGHAPPSASGDGELPRRRAPALRPARRRAAPPSSTCAAKLLLPVPPSAPSGGEQPPPALLSPRLVARAAAASAPPSAPQLRRAAAATDPPTAAAVSSRRHKSSFPGAPAAPPLPAPPPPPLHSPARHLREMSEWMRLREMRSEWIRVFWSI